MSGQELPQPPHGLIGLQPASAWAGVHPAIWCLGFAAIAVAAAYFWWRWRHRRQKQVLLPPIDPWEELLRAVEEVGEPRAAQDEVAYYLQLSGYLRQALELRFGFHATSQTLAELQASLGRIEGLEAEQLHRYLQFLSLADRVKFAGAAHRTNGLDAANDLDGHRLWKQNVMGWIKEARPRA